MIAICNTNNSIDDDNNGSNNTKKCYKLSLQRYTNSDNKFEKS